MKNVSPFNKLLYVTAFCAFLSCNSGNDKNNEKKTDSMAPMSATAAPVVKDELFVKHKVADFDKWKPVYDADSANRMAAGLHDHIIGRGAEDKNMVLVIMYMDDLAKAKAMAADPKLKEAMKKGGVTGAPEIEYIHRVWNDTAATSQSARMMVSVKVKDWDAWKKVFDSDKQARENAGIADRMIGHVIGDTHEVRLVFVINDEAKSKAFMNSKELKAKMKESGVEGAPKFFAYTVAQKKN